MFPVPARAMAKSGPVRSDHKRRTLCLALNRLRQKRVLVWLIAAAKIIGETDRLIR